MYPPECFTPPNSGSDTLETSPYKGRRQIAATYYPKAFSEGLGKFMSIYYGAVAEIDYHVGRLLNHLDALKLSDNTFVVFVSDHSELLGAHGMIGKGNFYEESVRIPLIIRAPDGVAGQVCEESVNQVDMVATICDYCGVNNQLPTHGQSLRALVCGETGDHRAFTFCEHENRQTTKEGDLLGSRMVRSKDWKYMACRNGKEGLYDLRHDPGEMHNLIGTNDTPTLTQRTRMQHALFEWMAETEDPALPGFKQHFGENAE